MEEITPLWRSRVCSTNSAIAMLHAFFDHAAPAQAMIGQLAIPLVVVVSHFAFFNRLLRQFGFGPGFGAREFVRLAFAVGIVPGVEKLARVAPLRLSFRRPAVEAFRRDRVFVFDSRKALPAFQVPEPNRRWERAIETANRRDSWPSGCRRPWLTGRTRYSLATVSSSETIWP